LKTLKLLLERLGNRRVTVCRELTKKHETAFLTTLEEAVAFYEEQEPKGECVLVLEGKSWESIEQESRERWEEMTIEEHMEVYLNQGLSKKDAMKSVAKDRGISKRDVYQYLETE
jgi:16S rRNA (cytidine1402-2'-O)-methyltransferase